ncbi:MAG TPA: nucleotidyltransferase domain-containing protein [Granulicella sp.]|nr:nucleotidyltransferase domain-containing protein [Granulicella sp.]
MDSLGNLLFGQTRGRVLALLYGMPDQAFFVRQIARQTGTSVGTVQRELETLSQSGLIARSMSGMQVFYQANRSHPVFAEIHSLVAKTSGIFQQLRSALSPFVSRIAVAVVYGSLARGDANAQSDVDLLIMGDVTLDEVLDQLSPLEPVLGRPINPTIYSREEFASKRKSGNHFLNSLMQSKKVFLIGDEDEFGKVG